MLNVCRVLFFKKIKKVSGIRDVKITPECDPNVYHITGNGQLFASTLAAVAASQQLYHSGSRI